MEKESNLQNSNFPENDKTREWDKYYKETFKPAWSQLTVTEQRIIMYITFEFSGEDEHKLPNQDELEKSAKDKLSKAGIDVYKLREYLERPS